MSKKSAERAGLKKSAVVLASQTPFTVSEVEALHILFKKLSSSMVDDGLIDKRCFEKEEFKLALLGRSSKQNLFVDRVFHAFDLKQNGVIEFGEFVLVLKMNNLPAVAFGLYDLRQTGYIERAELKKMVLALLEESNLTLLDDHVEAILDKTFMEADAKQDGRIDHDEWADYIAKNPSLMKNLTIPCLKYVSTAFPSFVFNTEVQDSDLSVGKTSSENLL
ncbi:hypothetical protein Ancab_015482 [Ancistrocladus abbreviatus]